MRTTLVFRRAAEAYLLATVLAACFPPVSRAADNAVTSETRADFTWFSGLGFPDVKNAPFVRVTTRWLYNGGTPSQTSQTNQFLGFLLSTNSSSFKVLDMDLSQTTLTNRASRASAEQANAFAKVELKAWAGQFLDYHEKPREPDVEAELWRRFGERVTERSQIFVLAWACWRQGLDDEAQRLYAVAQKTRKYTGPDDSALSLRDKLQKDLGTAMMWRAVLNFGDPSISRTELRGQFLAIATNFPASEYHDRALDTADRLGKTIAQDEQHAKSPPGPLDQLPMEQKIRELIFQLREQNGQQWSQPGECDIFLVPDGSTNTPAHQLVRIGYPAVPQLIAALDDRTFTRSIGYHRNFYFSHTVLTVGDCAVAILDSIAGRTFDPRKTTSSYLSKDGDVAQVRKDVEAWWAEVQTKGEKQMLVEATERGNSPGQARLLWQRYPEVAPDATIKGVRASKEMWGRVELIDLLAGSDNPAVLQFLDEEMRSGPDENSRVTAARVLERKGRSEAIAAMIHEWETVPENRPANLHGATAIVSFLARVDSPAAIAALGRDIQKRANLSRMAIVEAVGEGLESFGRPARKRSEATDRAAEELLVNALRDTAQEMGTSGTRMGKAYQDPRICDMAGFFLNQAWPNRYDFDLAASLKDRDRQRVECQNAWRKANNRPELPLPKPRATKLPPANANKVVTVEWPEDGVTPAKELMSAVEVLKENLLTTAEVVGILTNYCSQRIEGIGGIDLLIRKDDDLTGVAISVRLLPGAPPGRGRSWKTVHQTVSSGATALLGMSGQMFLDYSQEARGWTDLTKAADKALAAAPQTPFLIHVRMLANE